MRSSGCTAGRGQAAEDRFDPKLGIADAAATYADWKFVYQPEADAGAAPASSTITRTRRVN